MYRIFCQNVKNFFILNQEGEFKDEFRLRIAQPIKGLANFELYTKWKNDIDEKYDEVNNLVYEISKNTDEFHYFKTFSRELWGYGYESALKEKFSEHIVKEQLKLINLLIGTQYWVELKTLSN